MAGVMDVIILTGGTSSRMGADKASIEVDGRTLLDRVLAAAEPVADSVIVVGNPMKTQSPVTFTLEDPPHGGPVAGIAAGVELATSDEVMLLAVDLTHPTSVVTILNAFELWYDGIALVDSKGWPQYLAARYKTASLRERLSAMDDVRDASVRRFASALNMTLVPVPDEITADMDTPDDLDSAR